MDKLSSEESSRSFRGPPASRPVSRQVKTGGSKDKRNQRRCRNQNRLNDQLVNMRIAESVYDQPAHRSPRNRKPRRQSNEQKPFSVLDHVNATCRFVLKQGEGITPQDIAVDSPINPKQLLRIYSPPEDCPICLEVCEIPRMMSCGHMICLHCLVDHNKYSPSPEVCPICGDIMSPHPLRTIPVTFLHVSKRPDPFTEYALESNSLPATAVDSLTPINVDPNPESTFAPTSVSPISVSAESSPESTSAPSSTSLDPSRFYPVSVVPTPGEISQFVLVSRPANSSLSLPAPFKPAAIARSNTFPGPEYIKFSRVCQGTNEWARSELGKEIKMLVAAKKAEFSEFGKDRNAILAYDSAINFIGQAMTALQTSNDDESPKKKNKNKNNNMKADESSFTYFQTCFESPVVYTLSALDVSILKAQFGSYADFPSTISAKVENITSTKLSKQNSANRLKYLSHLPDQTPLTFVDCDWTGIVSDEVLNKFGSKIAERRRVHEQTLVKEQNETLKAQTSIESQFRFEVEEAKRPTSMFSSSQVSIDKSMLPALPTNRNRTEQEPQKPKWVQQESNFDIMKNTYVPKRGRKDVIIRF